MIIQRWVSDDPPSATKIRDGNIWGDPWLEKHYVYTWDAWKPTLDEFLSSDYNPVTKAVRKAINEDATKVAAISIAVPVLTTLAFGSISTYIGMEIELYDGLVLSDFTSTQAVTTYMAGLGTAAAYERVMSGLTDAGGQFSFGLVNNYDKRYSLLKNMKKSLFNINWNSVAWSITCPENNVVNYAFTGLMSNALKWSIDQKFEFGSTTEIATGMIFDPLFGTFGGKSGDGAGDWFKRARLPVEKKWDIHFNEIGKNPLYKMANYHQLTLTEKEVFTKLYKSNLRRTFTNAMFGEFDYYTKRTLIHGGISGLFQHHKNAAINLFNY